MHEPRYCHKNGTFTCDMCDEVMCPHKYDDGKIVKTGTSIATNALFGVLGFALGQITQRQRIEKQIRDEKIKEEVRDIEDDFRRKQR